MHVSIIGLASLGLSAISVTLIVGFLVRRPVVTAGVKLGLLLSICVLPTTAAMLGNVSNFQTTEKVSFCAECHVMTSYVRNIHDPKAKNLAAVHGQLPAYSDEACYGCHADYGMFGGVTTKLGGMRHVLDFYTNDWAKKGHRAPRLYKPYDTKRCVQCHNPLRDDAPLEHRVHAAQIENGSVSCAAIGCHGPPHPEWVQEVEK